MNTPTEVMMLNGIEYNQKFIYPSENVLPKNLPDEERSEKIVAYLG